MSKNLGIASKKTTAIAGENVMHRCARRESERCRASSTTLLVILLSVNVPACVRINSGEELATLKISTFCSVYPRRHVHVSVDGLAEFQQEPVIALVVVGAQIICLGVKGLAGKHDPSVEENGFSNG